MADLATAAGVDWMCFEGDYCWVWGGSGGGIGFVGEKCGYEAVLDSGGVGVGGEIGEGEVMEAHSLSIEKQR